MSSDALSALAAIMVAQAQEVFVAKAIADSMKDGIIAKLCAQGEDFYQDALTKMKKDNVRNLWESTWMNHVSLHVYRIFQGIQNFH